MSTKTEVETTTETSTVTRTKGACAMGAGALAITCKAMTLGFFAAGLSLVGLSGVGPLALMAGVTVLASVFMWKGFRWAGRRPALLGIGGIVTMFLGYVASGLFITSKAAGGSRDLVGSIRFGMFPAQDILANPMGLIPVAILYIAGTALIFAAVYDSYIKEMDVFDSRSGMAAGIVGASVCGGCGLTGIAGAGMVLLTGASATNATKFTGADALMLLAAVGIGAHTVYKQAWKQTALAVGGAIFAFFLTSGLYGFPAEEGFLGMMGIVYKGDLGSMVTTMYTWIGLGLLFLGLIWAACPHLELVPPEWKARLLRTSTSKTT